MNKQENTQINRETQSVLTHVEDSVGKLNVEKAMTVNSEFIESIEPEIAEETLDEPEPRVAEDTEQEVVEESPSEVSPIKEEQTDLVFSHLHNILVKSEIAITEGPQAQTSEEAEPKKTLEEFKTDPVEEPQQEAITESKFIVFVGSESELEVVKESGPFIIDVAQDALRQITQGPRTVISYIQEIVGISNAQERNELGTKFIEVSETKPKDKLGEPKTDIVKEPQPEGLVEPKTVVTEESKPEKPDPGNR